MSFIIRVVKITYVLFQGDNNRRSPGSRARASNSNCRNGSRGTACGIVSDLEIRALHDLQNPRSPRVARTTRCPWSRSDKRRSTRPGQADRSRAWSCPRPLVAAPPGQQVVLATLPFPRLVRIASENRSRSTAGSAVIHHGRARVQGVGRGRGNYGLAGLLASVSRGPAKILQDLPDAPIVGEFAMDTRRNFLQNTLTLAVTGAQPP